MSDRQKLSEQGSIRERVERLVALENCKQVIEALHITLGALDHITHCRTLGHADSTAREAILEVERVLGPGDTSS